MNKSARCIILLKPSSHLASITLHLSAEKIAKNVNFLFSFNENEMTQMLNSNLLQPLLITDPEMSSKITKWKSQEINK